MITKRTKVFLVVLVLVALGAHAYLYWWSTTEDHGVLDTIPGVSDVSETLSDTVRPKPAAAPGTSNTPTTETPSAAIAYETYENTGFGFSFSHPELWQPSLTTTENGTDICFTPAEGTGGCRLSVRIAQESVNVSMEQTLEALAAEYRTGRITTSSRRVGGEAAAVLSVSGYPAGEEGSTRAAVFVHERNVYTIEAAAGQEAVFDRVLSSFDFQ